MDFKFSKDTGESPKQTAGGDKGRQNILLVVLLLLVGGFGYVYFFTGLIRPQEEQKPAEMPPPQVVKKPLPSRGGEAATAVPPATPEGKKEGAVAPAKPEAPKSAQAVAPAPAAKAVPVAGKPAPPKPMEKKAQPAPEKQPRKQVVAKAEEKKPAPAEKKQPAAAQKKTAPVASAEKKEGAAKKPTARAEKKQAPEPGRALGGRWTVSVGNYLLEDALAADMVRVRKAGLEAAVQPGAKRKTPMNRLLLGEYDDRVVARAELDKLKHYTSDAFIIEHGGKFAVYAGSYLLDGRAASEKERLAAAGFTLTLKRAEVAIPSKLLTAGTFDDKKSAEAALKKLKNVGLKASLVRQ
ncbi:MAG TPA: SPOR domain-containing protein [Desulfuromonadaceae bacterium]